MTISVIGIGEDGVLGSEALALLAGAALVYGGARHLALAAHAITGEARRWPSPMEQALPAIAAHPGAVAILASGDPLWFGAGSWLLARLPAGRLRVVPAVSSFQWAAARLGWALQDVACLSCCGRPPAAVIPHLQPGARLLILSAGPETPDQLRALLSGRGLEHRVQVVQRLGGPDEAAWRGGEADPLNLVALEVLGPAAAALPLTAGRPERWFEHDGQITRPAVRAMTLAALAPRRGEVLWDVGAGSGAVGIEWMLAHPDNVAVGLERRADRAARARRNAVALGVPGLTVVEADAPGGFAGLAAPDAIFLGGGAHEPGVIEAAWAALRPGGRLVANAVALATEAALAAAQQRLGGTLLRLGMETLDRVGGMPAYRPAMTVTQWAVEK